MNYWLFKSEPYKWSWQDQVNAGQNHWQKPVRNYQARNNIRAMKPGDQAFFYHSNEGKEIVGILEIKSEAYQDPTDDTGKFSTIDIAPLTSINNPVTLKELKNQPNLENMSFIRQSRLSVSPVTKDEWDIVCAMANA